MAGRWILMAAALAWSDPSPHRTQFVDVESGVRLEALDWGGSGRAVVLLAGSGNTAHVFDEFAPRVKRFAHVYGITRRGYGASSQPASGYDDQRLADDVLAVLKALKLKRPVLVGHSMAGGELTTLGNQHSDLLGGLVYLDALGDPRDWPGSDPAYREILAKLPPSPAPAPAPAGEDPRTFAGYRARQMRAERFAFPESELRNAWVVNADGTMGRHKTSSAIHNAVGDGQKKRDYSGIRVPVLAFFDFLRTLDTHPGPEELRAMNNEEREAFREFESRDEEGRKAVTAFIVATKAFIDRWVANLKQSVPDARLVDTRGGRHYVFLTREEQVLRELRKFVGELRRP